MQHVKLEGLRAYWLNCTEWQEVELTAVIVVSSRLAAIQPSSSHIPWNAAIDRAAVIYINLEAKQFTEHGSCAIKGDHLQVIIKKHIWTPSWILEVSSFVVFGTIIFYRLIIWQLCLWSARKMRGKEEEMSIRSHAKKIESCCVPNDARRRDLIWFVCEKLLEKPRRNERSPAEHGRSFYFQRLRLAALSKRRDMC